MELNMGSMVYLSLGRVHVDSGRNEGFTRHGALFRPEHAAQVPHFYAGDEDDKSLHHLPLIKTSWGAYRHIVEFKPGLSAPLWEVAERLYMLGYTEEYCRGEFEVLGEDRDAAKHDFTFKALSTILQNADFSEAAVQEGKESLGFAPFLSQYVLPQFGKDAVSRLRLGEYDEVNGISPLSALYLLSKNPTARDLPVTWDYADVKEGGYAPASDFNAGVSEGGRYLLVTEGTSDAQILKHALTLLRPNIADFFHFVDMQDNYPFSGTGNLYRFVQGLVSIRIQNSMLVIFDNDAEGTFNCERTKKLTPLPNLRILKLPDMKRFKRFRTIGPTGKRIADINGKAAAIECYLDVGEAPAVRWTNYDSSQDCYQGHIVNKAELAKAFLEQRARKAKYDYTGLEAVLDLITTTCANMAAKDSLESLKRIVYL